MNSADNDRKGNQMKLEQILKIAKKNYPGRIPLTENDELNHRGDGLALFISQELRETYEEDQSSENKLLRAIEVMRIAAQELDRIANALGEDNAQSYS